MSITPPPSPPTQVLDSDTRLRFLRSFDCTTPVGRRDHTIALCFSELALRASEVAALTLDDVDWRALTVRLRKTKQRRERLLVGAGTASHHATHFDHPIQAARQAVDRLPHARGDRSDPGGDRGYVDRSPGSSAYPAAL